MPRIAFVHAVDPKTSETQMFGIYFMPVWAYTLAAHLEAVPGLEVALLDLRVDAGASCEADVYLFTGINQDFEAIMQEAQRLRKLAPRALFVLGGPITWSYDTAGRLERLLSFDHVFIGDGEETLPAFIRQWQAGAEMPQVIRAPARFDLTKSLPMNDGLLRQSATRYYGGVLEVSRGCPFLCEFCDIRVQPDNNRSHVKPPELIVAELDRFWELGIRQTLFACDNFIGNHVWAEQVCDRIIEWKARTGRSISLYTWLTIDVSRHPRLLEKLRVAGFDMFFIGVESFNRTSLLETAKVQNTTLELIEALRSIQSHGFVVVAGLIMGFDTDTDHVVDVTLDGIVKAGLISGDPSLLTALPGTPLYRRMQLSGRLRDAKLGLGGFKYRTNIRYLRAAADIRSDFIRFVREFNRGSYQLRRLRSFLACLDGPAYRAPATREGYADLGKLLKMTLKRPLYAYLFLKRLLKLVRHPGRLCSIMMGLALVSKRALRGQDCWFYFKFWLFNWSNSIIKYSSLSPADFDIESVPEVFDMESVLPENYQTNIETEIPLSKVRAQRKLTTDSLRGFISARKRG